MKNIFTLFALILGIFHSAAQITNVEEKFPLPEVLNESSGAIFFNNKLISHNDSGHENKLYELDTITGTITRTLTITNATNVDRKSTRLNSSHVRISYAVFCLKKKNQKKLRLVPVPPLPVAALEPDRAALLLALVEGVQLAAAVRLPLLALVVDLVALVHALDR